MLSVAYTIKMGVVILNVVMLNVWRQSQVLLNSYFEKTLSRNICPAWRHAFRSKDFSSNAFLPTDPIELKYQNDCRH